MWAGRQFVRPALWLVPSRIPAGLVHQPIGLTALFFWSATRAQFVFSLPVQPVAFFLRSAIVTPLGTGVCAPVSVVVACAPVSLKSNSTLELPAHAVNVMSSVSVVAAIPDGFAHVLVNVNPAP